MSDSLALADESLGSASADVARGDESSEQINDNPMEAGSATVNDMAGDDESTKPDQHEGEQDVAAGENVATDAQPSWMILQSKSEMAELRNALRSLVFRYPDAPDLEDRRTASRQGNLQALTYFYHLEDTIKDLEARLKEVEYTTKMKDRPWDDSGDPNAEPKPTLRIIFMTWLQYVVPRVKGQQGEINMIEVCVDRAHRLSAAEYYDIVKLTTTSGHHDPSVVQGGSIERFRIRSTPINDLISKILKVNKPDNMQSHIRPFKAIMRAKTGLIQEYEQLVQQHSGIAAGETEALEKKQLREQLEFLLHFLDGLFKPIVDRYDRLSLYEVNSTPLSARFDELWYVFLPGRLVYNPRQSQAYIVLYSVGGRPVLRARDQFYATPPDIWAKSQEGSTNILHISVVYLSYNGKQIGPVQEDFSISPYEGQRSLTSLPIYPMECADSIKETHAHSTAIGAADSQLGSASNTSDTVLRKLEVRGRKYLELVKNGKPSHKDYRGFTLGDLREQVESRVVIDFEYFYQSRISEVPELGFHTKNPHDARETSEATLTPCVCGTRRCKGLEHAGWGIFPDTEIDDQMTTTCRDQHAPLFNWDSSQEELQASYIHLFPREVHAFVLHNRTWSRLDIDNVTDVVDRKESFQHLELNEQHKRIVEAVVRRHSAGAKPVAGVKADQDSFLDDLVRGKGKGIIILLHGVPGVGKTSTAETVADLTERPLFALTCGDVGTTATEVQQNLDENFKLAHRWGCVMLLDEADVFLQQRDRRDMHRNAIVSVFLRVLEYYSGILFLTTNKVGTFDEAFKSRIHIALYYEPLKWPASERIWRHNLDRIQRARPHMKMNRDKLVEWAKKEWHKSEQGQRNKNYRPWNGRQIHNACQTAASLAEHAAYGDSDILPANTKVWLKKEHLIDVAKAIKEFDKYLIMTHGSDDYTRAAELHDRGEIRYNEPKPIVARRARRQEVVEDEDDDDDDDDDEDEYEGDD